MFSYTLLKSGYILLGFSLLRSLTSCKKCLMYVTIPPYLRLLESETGDQ